MANAVKIFYTSEIMNTTISYLFFNYKTTIGNPPLSPWIKEVVQKSGFKCRSKQTLELSNYFQRKYIINLDDYSFIPMFIIFRERSQGHVKPEKYQQSIVTLRYVGNPDHRCVPLILCVIIGWQTCIMQCYPWMSWQSRPLMGVSLFKCVIVCW